MPWQPSEEPSWTDPQNTETPMHEDEDVPALDMASSPAAPTPKTLQINSVMPEATSSSSASGSMGLAPPWPPRSPPAKIATNSSVPSKPPPIHQSPSTGAKPEVTYKGAPPSLQWLAPKPPPPSCIQNVMVRTQVLFKSLPKAGQTAIIDEDEGMPIDLSMTDNNKILRTARHLAKRAVEHLGGTIKASAMKDGAPPPAVSFQGPGDAILANLMAWENIHLDIDIKENTTGRRIRIATTDATFYNYHHCHVSSMLAGKATIQVVQEPPMATIAESADQGQVEFTAATSSACKSDAPAQTRPCGELRATEFTTDDDLKMPPFAAGTEFKDYSPPTTPTSKGINDMSQAQEDAMATFGKAKGAKFIKPGHTVPLAQCAICGRYHMWLTRHRQTRELLLRCFAWPICRGAIPNPEMMPDNYFQLNTVIEGERTNQDSSLGAPLAITMWKKLVLKTVKIKARPWTTLTVV